MKVKQVLIFAVVILLSTYALFRFISFKQSNWLSNSHSNNNQSDDTPIQNKVVFGVESQFSQYTVEHNSVNQQMLGDIAHDLKLDITGWSQFGTFDLVYPDKVEFIFADINLLSEPEKQQLLNKSINNDHKLIAGVKSNFNQTTRTLTYTLYMDRAFYTDSPDTNSIALYWSRKIVHMLCSCNQALFKNHKIDSKYKAIVDKFNLNNQAFFAINQQKISFLQSLLQKINLVQPVFAEGCSGQWWCIPQNNHWVCPNDYSTDCKYYDPSYYCGAGTTSCTNRPTCSGTPESHPCVGNTMDACYTDDLGCPTGYCNPAEVSGCDWDPGSVPVPTTTPGGPTPTPHPPSVEPSCGCCDADDWDVDTGCWERNGVPGLQCCCGNSCGRFSDNSCLTASRCAGPVYWVKNVCGYVTDSNTGEPVEGVRIRITKRERKIGDSTQTQWRYPDVLTTDASGRFMRSEYLNMATEHDWERMYNVMALPVIGDTETTDEIVTTFRYIGMPLHSMTDWYVETGSNCFGSTCDYEYEFGDDSLIAWNNLPKYQTANITANYKKIVTSTLEDTRQIGPNLPASMFNKNTPLGSIGYFYQMPLSTNNDYNDAAEIARGSRDCAGKLNDNNPGHQECRCNFIAISRYDAYVAGKIQFDAKFFTPEVCTGSYQAPSLNVTCNTVVADWSCTNQQAFFSTEKKFEQGDSVTCIATNAPSGYHFEKVSVVNDAHSVLDQACDPNNCQITFTADEGFDEEGGNMVNFYLSADISGNFYLGKGVGTSETVCNPDGVPSNLTLNNQANIYLDPDGVPPISTSNSQSLADDHYLYTINHYGISGSTDYLLKLEPGFTADMQTGYICNCPADCTYTGINPTASRDFYITALDLSNDSWFQSFGANIYSKSNIISKIPDQCVDEPTCYSALQIANLSNTINSPGFPITYAGTIQTNKDNSKTYIHLDDERDLASQAFATDSQLPQHNFTYFEDKLASEDIEDLDNFSDISDDDLSDGELHIYQKSTGDLAIDPANTRAISNQTQLIVLVNDNVNIDNSSDLDQLISVEPGSFLIFIVGGNINIAPEIGYALPATASNSPNLEGVYLADGTININSFGDTTTQDKKFIGAGTFIGWTNINLARNYGNDTSNPISMADNNTNPTETFIYRPDFVVNFPDELKDFLSNWREVNPSW